MVYIVYRIIFTLLANLNLVIKFITILKINFNSHIKLIIEPNLIIIYFIIYVGIRFIYLVSDNIKNSRRIYQIRQYYETLKNKIICIDSQW